MFVCYVCCQVEVSATGWWLVQRSPTDCGVWYIETSWMRRPWLTRGCRAKNKQNVTKCLQFAQRKVTELSVQYHNNCSQASLAIFRYFGSQIQIPKIRYPPQIPAIATPHPENFISRTSERCLSNNYFFDFKLMKMRPRYPIFRYQAFLSGGGGWTRVR
jgi:hypothetical protein